MVFILPVDPGNTNKLCIPKQIRKRKSDNDISVTKYDSDMEGSGTVERKIKKAQSFLNEKGKGKHKGKATKKRERSLTPEVKTEAKVEKKKDEVVEVIDEVGSSDQDIEIEDETDSYDDLIQTLRKSSQSNKEVKKLPLENY